MAELTPAQQVRYKEIMEDIGAGDDTQDIDRRINNYLSTQEMQELIAAGVDFENDKLFIYLCRYNNIIEYIQAGQTAQEIQMRINDFRRTGELDRYESWGVENDLAFLKRDCYRNMLKDLAAISPEKLQESINYYINTGQWDIFISWGMDVESDLGKLRSDAWGGGWPTETEQQAPGDPGQAATDDVAEREAAWEAQYLEMLAYIDDGVTTQARLKRIKECEDNGSIAAFKLSTLDVDNDLTYLHQQRYRNIMTDFRLTDSPVDRRKKYFYYHAELELMRKLHLLADLEPSIDRDLADLGLQTKEKVNYGDFLQDLAGCRSTEQRLEKLNLYREDGSLANYRAAGYPVNDNLAALGLGLQCRLSPVMPTNAAEAAWIARYNVITDDLDNTGRWEERNTKFQGYKAELANMNASGLPVNKDLEFFGLGADFGMQFAVDAADTAKNFVAGGFQGGGEMMRTDYGVESMHTSPGSHVNPHWSGGNLKPGYTQNDLQYALDQHSKATEAFMTETGEPVAVAAGVTFAPGVAVPAILGLQAARGYQTAEGSTGDKIAGGIRAATIQPLQEVYAKIESGELAREFDAHPAQTVGNVAGAVGQALMVAEFARPMVKAGAAKIGKGPGKIGEALRQADIYRGLEPEAALADGRILKDVLKEDGKIAADNRSEITITSDPRKYRALTNGDGKIPPQELSKEYKQNLGKGITITGEYKPYELNQHSQVLGKEMENRGMSRPDDHYQAHHLFPIGDFLNRGTRVRQAAARIKKAFADCHMPQDCAANGMWLPDKYADRSLCPKDTALHCGAPCDTYILEAAKVLQEAESLTPEIIAQEAQKLRERLLSGELKINDAAPQIGLEGETHGRNAVIGLSVGQLNKGYDREGVEDAQPNMPQINGTGMFGVKDSKAISPAEESRLNTSLVFSPEGIQSPAHVNFNDLCGIIQRQAAELAERQQEREKYQDAPLTREQAEQLSTSDYVQGEDKQLARQSIALRDERAQLAQAEARHIDYGRQTGLARAYMQYIPGFMQSDELKNYHREGNELAQRKEALAGGERELAAKTGKLQAGLQTPEARAAIAEKTLQYLTEDAARQIRLNHVEAQIAGLQQNMTANICRATGIVVHSSVNDAPEQKMEAWKRITEIINVKQSPDPAVMGKLRIGEGWEYRLQAKAILEREGRWPGPSADRKIVQNMAARGYSDLAIKMAVLDNSIETAGAPFDRGIKYVSQITDQTVIPGHNHRLHR